MKKSLPFSGLPMMATRLRILALLLKKMNSVSLAVSGGSISALTTRPRRRAPLTRYCAGNTGGVRDEIREKLIGYLTVAAS